jgi:hypothetical protein
MVFSRPYFNSLIWIGRSHRVLGWTVFYSGFFALRCFMLLFTPFWSLIRVQKLLVSRNCYDRSCVRYDGSPANSWLSSRSLDDNHVHGSKWLFLRLFSHTCGGRDHVNPLSFPRQRSPQWLLMRPLFFLLLNRRYFWTLDWKLLIHQRWLCRDLQHCWGDVLSIGSAVHRALQRVSNWCDSHTCN